MINYNDSAPSPSVTSSRLMNASGMWDTSVAVMDGLGHTVHTQLTTDPQGTDYVDTSYDGMGRPFTTSNPHRSSPLQTDGTTTYIYDALGRPTLLTHPDASTVQWLCNGNIATSIDEGGTRGSEHRMPWAV